jgi:hypothetical protein
LEIDAGPRINVQSLRGTDNSLGYRKTDSEGVADGQNDVTYENFARLFKREGVKIIKFNLKHREITERVITKEFGPCFSAVSEYHQNVRGVGDYVTISGDVTVTANYHSRAKNGTFIFILSEHAKVTG